MSPDAELLVIFGVLHLVALVLGGALFLMFLRSDRRIALVPATTRTTPGAAATTASRDKPKTSPPAASRCRSRSSRDKRAALAATTSSPTPAGRRVRTRKPLEPARPGAAAA